MRFYRSQRKGLVLGVDGFDCLDGVGSGLSLLLHEIVVDGLGRFAELCALLGGEDYDGRAALLDLLAEEVVVLLDFLTLPVDGLGGGFLDYLLLVVVKSLPCEGGDDERAGVVDVARLDNVLLDFIEARVDYVRVGVLLRVYRALLERSAV